MRHESATTDKNPSETSEVMNVGMSKNSMPCLCIGKVQRQAGVNDSIGFSYDGC